MLGIEGLYDEGSRYTTQQDRKTYRAMLLVTMYASVAAM